MGAASARLRCPRRYDVSFDDLDGVEKFASCGHQVMINAYYDGWR